MKRQKWTKKREKESVVSAVLQMEKGTSLDSEKYGGKSCFLALLNVYISTYSDPGNALCQRISNFKCSDFFYYQREGLL